MDGRNANGSELAVRQVVDLERELTEAGILGGVLSNRTTAHYIQEALRLVAKSHGVTVARLLGNSRQKAIARARRDAYAALRNLGMSQPEIGRAVGGRDASTVWWGLRKREAELSASGKEVQWKEIRT